MDEWMHACMNLLITNRSREGIRKKFYNVLLYLDMNLGSLMHPACSTPVFQIRNHDGQD